MMAWRRFSLRPCRLSSASNAHIVEMENENDEDAKRPKLYNTTDKYP
jgi:hypothetical protein